MKNQTFGEHAWQFEAEAIDRLPCDVFSVGIGKHLVVESRCSPESIIEGLKDVFAQLIDGGANMGMVEGVRTYFRRRGKAVDIGTMADFTELGWAAICDLCDAESR